MAEAIERLDTHVLPNRLIDGVRRDRALFLRFWKSHHVAALALGLLLFCGIWLLAMSLSGENLPKDNVEQLTWVHSLEWGYYKHPPLPTWLLWPLVQVFGHVPWVTYVAAALCTLLSMGLLWFLVARLRGRRHATLALLAVLCITYYNGRIHFYNHNTVLMPFAVGSALFCWMAFSTGRLRWWFALGVCIGLGALAKYQIAVAAVCVFVFWMLQGGWRSPTHRLGLALSAFVSLAIFSPHLYWLSQNDFGPVRYAMTSSLGVRLSWVERFPVSAHWLADQVLNRALPALMLLLLVRVAAGRSAEWSRAGRSSAGACDAPGSTSLIFCFGFLPLAVPCAMAMLAGTEPHLQWGTPFLLLAVPALMELASGGQRGRCWSLVPLRVSLTAFVAIQALLLLVLHVHCLSATGPDEAARQNKWRDVDLQSLADAVANDARRALAGPIRIVSGPPAEAGALSLLLEEHPLVLIDGRYDISPWVSKPLVDACGALEISAYRTLPDQRPIGANPPKFYWRIQPPVIATEGNSERRPSCSTGT
ncbi:ArnT family glycosyltransferase [Variovorax sp. GB1P17]|uniref:ArnT family glycosyltransferase n=1 Tax=Variovorax sp. GB1P17 TaxID=3443740 RepID=UPI003F447D4E